jgi:hypothetical protein
MKRTALCLVAVALWASCASKRPPARPTGPPPIRAIAVVTGDALARAVSAELYNQGFRTFELPVTQSMTPAALQSLAGRGVDAVLVVTFVKGIDSNPDSANMRLVRTGNSETVAAFDWSNNALGATRRNMDDSARDLVQTLLRAIPKP